LRERTLADGKERRAGNAGVQDRYLCQLAAADMCLLGTCAVDARAPVRKPGIGTPDIGVALCSFRSFCDVDGMYLFAVAAELVVVAGFPARVGLSQPRRSKIELG